MSLFCPKCGYPQYCGCDSCKDRLPKDIEPYTYDETGNCIYCANCGLTMHEDWWLTLSGDIYIESEREKPIQDLVIAKRNDEITKLYNLSYSVEFISGVYRLPEEDVIHICKRGY